MWSRSWLTRDSLPGQKSTCPPRFRSLAPPRAHRSLRKDRGRTSVHRSPQKAFGRTAASARTATRGLEELLRIRQRFPSIKRSCETGSQQSHTDSGKGVGVLDAPASVQAQCVVLDEFLAPQELDELISYALQHEAEFQSSGVVSPSGDPGVIDYNHRRSRVLMDLGKHEQVILERIRGVLPRVLDQLGIEEFPVTRVEAQITASNDGDFFGAHSDDSHELIAARRLTFVYFFHREPRQFEGGELRLHDSRGSDRLVGSYQTGGYQTGGYQTIMPQQNQIVFFPCSLLHEITPVECPSRAFADGRFTLNGWLHG